MLELSVSQSTVKVYYTYNNLIHTKYTNFNLEKIQNIRYYLHKG